MLGALELTALGGSVMSKTDITLQNSSVMPELARPMFPTIRVIPSIFTEMMFFSIEASVSKMISEQRIEGDSRGELGRIVRWMMMAG